MSRAAAALAAAFLAVVLFAAPSARAQPTTYKIDRAKTRVYMVMLKAPSLASSFSHDHAFRAPDVAGEIVYDAANPATSKVRVAVKTATIVVDEANARQRFGLQGQPSEKDIAAIDEDMKSADFLDVEKHPEVTFTSTAVKPLEEGKLLLSGDLTLHGKTRSVELPVTVTQNGAELSGNGKIVVKQSDYGIKPCNKFLGAVKCADEVALHLFLVGKP